MKKLDWGKWTSVRTSFLLISIFPRLITNNINNLQIKRG